MRFIVSLESAPGLGSPGSYWQVARAFRLHPDVGGTRLAVRRHDRALTLVAVFRSADQITATRAGVRLFAEALEQAGLQPEIAAARVVSLAA